MNCFTRAPITTTSSAIRSDAMEICADPLSKTELLAYQADLKGSIFRQIRQTFSRMKQHGVTQKTLARRIGMDEGQLSRRLRGDYDLRLETLSDLARGLECRIDVKLTPLTDVGAQDTKSETSTHSVVRGEKWEKYHEIARKEPSKYAIGTPNLPPSKENSSRRIEERSETNRDLEKGLALKVNSRDPAPERPSGKLYAYWKAARGQR